MEKSINAIKFFYLLLLHEPVHTHKLEQFCQVTNRVTFEADSFPSEMFSGLKVVANADL